jgi:hypothetical protein
MSALELGFKLFHYIFDVAAQIVGRSRGAYPLSCCQECLVGAFLNE